ncbi:MAG: DUF3500 domain-containing protein [Luteolibacter sp.]|uniref:DUF3500 domain-containing protein n=1 Tax=Luteolibacter sp. TaxID=1962973 RepID=UPI0032671788
MKNLLICAFFTLPLVAKELPAEVVSAAAAEKFLATLTPEQKTKAELPFTGDERENFHYTPHERAGLPLKEMNDAQRDAAMKLLDTALSEKGKLKITQIMTLEGVLAEIEKNPTYRDSGKYYVTIFGTPGTAKGWGWRFEGHHLSFNITLVEGKDISVTPSFLGTNPAEVREGPHKGLRVLAEEEDLARALITTLLTAGKSAAVFSEKPPAEILSAENRTATVLEAVGITAADMSDTQRAALLKLISQYTGRYRSEIAAADMAKIEKAGIDKIRFGWAGGTKPGEAYYYRIQGPTFLMESCNVQNEANHVHASWRDFTGDFGRDILGEHFKGGSN